MDLRKPNNCPKCSKNDIRQIVAGRPSKEGFEMIERGEAVIGTCFASLDRPDWRCMQCNHEWFDPSDPVRKEFDAIQQRIFGKSE